MPELTGYLAPRGFLTELQRELGDTVAETYGDLVLAAGPTRPIAWAANIWLAPARIGIASIGDAAKQLRAIQRNWALYPHTHHRRAALIVEKLPKVSAKPLAFGTPAPTAPLGSWTLLAPDLMLASANCSSPFPNGEVHFVEDRTAPNRAYLKLWEALTLIGRYPQPGELCLDLGASPGGWTWVLQKLGARVISVDKAALDPQITSLQSVVHRRESAFALDPQSFGPVDWLVADIACYPQRLLTLIRKWLAAGTARRFICTIKFQGPTDLDVMAEFAAIPGSRLIHLHHNKHELTWINLGAGS